MRKYLCLIFVVLILLVGCATTTQQPTAQEQVTTEPVEEVKEEPEETTEPVEEVEEEKGIPTDIKEVLEKGKTKLKSYSYNYKSPQNEESYVISVKGNKMKIVLPDIVDVEDEKFYNTMFFDTEAKTVQAYCVGYSRCGKSLGKVKDLNYEEAYIETPLDWLEKVTEAEKIDERTVEGRDSLYLQTNIGKITVASYNGFLYKIEDGKDKWEFTDAAFDSVKDSDVVP